MEKRILFTSYTLILYSTSGEMVVHAEVACPEAQTGLGDADAISGLVRMGKLRRTIQIKVDGGASHSIPLSYYYTVQQLRLLKLQGVGNQMSIEEDISFGDIVSTC